jgi:hypothetical protein
LTIRLANGLLNAWKAKVQNIGVQREDEFGGVIADFDTRGIDLRIVAAAPSSSGCLRFIDPYDNFLANQRQLPILIVELEEISRSTQDLEFKLRISDLVKFLENSKGPHVYVRFIGD